MGGTIAVGIAIAGSLFLLYPDMMFRNTGLGSQTSDRSTPVLIDTNNPTNKGGINMSDTNSTAANTTASSP